MKVLGYRKLEDCLDGSMIFELSFSRPISGNCITELGGIGELDYFKNFPRPFYRLIIGDDLQLKGVEENITARLILFRGGIDAFIDKLNNLFRQC